MFQIHSQLEKDCHLFGILNSCHVLLHKNAHLHWFILVPETELKNLLELDEKLLQHVMKSAQTINHYLVSTHGYKKINFASIGNMVDQLHIHTVGRNPDDICWPKPVWGNLPDGPAYHPHDILKIVEDLSLELS